MNFQRIHQQAMLSEMKDNIGDQNNVDLTLRLGLPNHHGDENHTTIRPSLNSTSMTTVLNSTVSHTQVPGGDHDRRRGNSQISWLMRGCEPHHVGMSSRLGRAGLGGAPTSNYTNIINGIVSCTNFARTFTPPPPPPPPPQMNAVDYIILNPSARRSQSRAGGSRRRSTTHRQRRSVVVDTNKRCTNYNCATSTTPMWRRGPLGPKSLCNACGIKYRKQEEKIKKQKEVVEQDAAALVHAGAAVDNKSDGSCTTLNDCY